MSKNCKSADQDIVYATVLRDSKFISSIQREKPKQAVQYRPKRRRNIGKPRKRWRDQLRLED